MGLNTELGERKLTILKAIIQNYLETGEPVGSRTLSKYTDLNLSSATIRNEMADLEDLGYIFQPHTSAGRIPSDKGYRLYVDMLMEEKEHEITELRNTMLEKSDKVDQVLKQAAKVLAVNTNYATMVSAPVNSRNTLKFIQLSQVDQEQIVAANGPEQKNYLGKSISSRLEEAILNRKTVLARPGEKAYFSILENTDNTTPLPELIFPILSSGDAIGSVILCGKDRESLPGDTEKKLLQVAATYLGREMEN